MKAIIQASQVSGTIIAPSSKSYTHRAIIIAALAQGTSVIEKPLISDDTNYTIAACRKLGAKINIKNNFLEIVGVNGKFLLGKNPTRIYCGNSGTTARLITTVATLTDGIVIVDGDRRLRQRPMIELINTLKTLRVNILSLNKEGFLPIKIYGRTLRGGTISVSGNVSSQFISALLILAPFVQKGIEIRATNLASAPYVDITIDVMKAFGVQVQKNKDKYLVKAKQKYLGRSYRVEGDWSSASYLFAAAAVTKSEITVSNLNPASTQGDKIFLDILENMGCNVKRDKNQITVLGKPLISISVDMKYFPDLVPSLAIVVAFVEGISKILNIANLRDKESDRILAISSNLTGMGIKTAEKYESLEIKGGKPRGNRVKTYNDHRIAMSFAVAALSTKGETTIQNAQVVSKSYPDFWDDLQKIGAKLKISD